MLLVYIYVCVIYTEQRWSDCNDSQAAPGMPYKSQRKSDATEEVIEENAGAQLHVFMVVYFCS